MASPAGTLRRCRTRVQGVRADECGVVRMDEAFLAAALCTTVCARVHGKPRGCARREVSFCKCNRSLAQASPHTAAIVAGAYLEQDGSSAWVASTSVRTLWRLALRAMGLRMSFAVCVVAKAAVSPCSTDELFCGERICAGDSALHIAPLPIPLIIVVIAPAVQRFHIRWHGNALQLAAPRRSTVYAADAAIRAGAHGACGRVRMCVQAA